MEKVQITCKMVFLWMQSKLFYLHRPATEVFSGQDLDFLNKHGSDSSSVSHLGKQLVAYVFCICLPKFPPFSFYHESKRERNEIELKKVIGNIGALFFSEN